MKIAIHQPEFLPWLGYFDKLSQVDTFVFLDNVDFRYHYFQNRNRIKSKRNVIWLNVPVLTKGKWGQQIKDVKINNSINWSRKVAQSIKFNYQKAPYFQDYFNQIVNVFNKKWANLADINIALIKLVSRFLDIDNVNFIKASDLELKQETGPELILNICKTMKSSYLLLGISGIAGTGTKHENEFNQHNIKIEYQSFYHPVYKQMDANFMPFLSVLDLLFNHGKDSLQIIRGNSVKRLDYTIE